MNEMEEEKVYAERPNKTAIKREMLELRDLGKQMIEMRSDWLDTIPMADQLRKEIIKAKKFKKGALRRQLIFIEKLMREEDAEQIKKSIDECLQPHKEDTDRFHQLEEWRDALVGEDNNLMEELLGRFVTLDRQHVRQLIRNIAKEAKLKKPPKSSRALFRYLKEHAE